MKKHNFTLFFIFFLFTISLYGQIEIIANMDTEVPEDWNNVSYFASDGQFNCQGSGMARAYFGGNSNEVISLSTPSKTSSGGNVTVGFTWKVSDFSSGEFTINTEVSYTINGASDIPIGSFISDGSTECTNFNTIIPGNQVQENESFKLKIKTTYKGAEGQIEFAIDDVRITQGCDGGDNVVLTSEGNTTKMTLSSSCTNEYSTIGKGFTYYAPPENPGKYLFAIEWGTNNNDARDGATVEITTLENIYSPSGNSPMNASLALPRFWNVELADGTSLTPPVRVKFYYDIDNKEAIEQMLNSDPENYNGFRWYKSKAGETYSHDEFVTAENFQDEVILLENVETGTENGVNFVEFDVESFSGGSGAAGAGSGFLPVTLLSFEGATRENSNLLTWSTATEENTEWHIIERSVDGRSDWLEVGRVHAAGESNQKLDYKLFDKLPPTEAYYRLTSLDYDVYKDLSKVIHIKRKSAPGDLKIYPNPVRQLLYVEYSSDYPETVEFKITDINGRLITTKSLDSDQGLNKHEYSFADFSKGVYLISLTSESQKVIQRIIKH